ncbi:MAG: RNA polymerase sigma factor, partial [Limisphaerales bacterium]
MTDAELLHEYVCEKSEAAFRELLERHLAMVYWAALRQVGDPTLAEDITQVVFILLARKAEGLASNTALPGWLFRTTRHAAAKAVRTEMRRQRREREAAEMGVMTPTDGIWRQVAPFLDEALAGLRKVEREAVLLHFFENKRLREVGLALGMSEDAVQKRVARSVVKLRKALLKHKLALGLDVLPGLLCTHGTQHVPAYLHTKVATAVFGKMTVSTTAYALLQQTKTEVLWPKMSGAARQAGALAVIAGAVVFFWPNHLRPKSLGYHLDSSVRPHVVAAASELENVEARPVQPPNVLPKLAPVSVLVAAQQSASPASSMPEPAVQQPWAAYAFPSNSPSPT